MVWDTTLEAAATSWAQGLANQGCNLQHGGMPANTGQNLYASWVSSMSWLSGFGWSHGVPRGSRALFRTPGPVALRLLTRTWLSM